MESTSVEGWRLVQAAKRFNSVSPRPMVFVNPPVADRLS
jgi:hypothetical protein